MLSLLVPRPSRKVVSRRRSARRRGMSLVEVMVVIAIILTLMSILAFGVFSAFGNAQYDMTKITMTRVAERIDIYQLRKKKAPGTNDGLTAVFGNEAVPMDGWNHPFMYVSPGPNGEPYELVSLGADGQEGGTGNDEDIVWSEVKKGG